VKCLRIFASLRHAVITSIDRTARMERAYAWTHKSVSDFLTWDPPVQVKPVEHNGVFYGSLAQFVSILGASLTFPFLQSQRDLLKCDALCYGSMQSARSALSLLGTVVAGRLSDKLGRIPVLWIGVIASLISLGINYTSPTIAAMWISMIPSALNQNWSVLKALFADYSNDVGGDEKKRAVAVGRLGMAVGISFMVRFSSFIMRALLSARTHPLSPSFLLEPSLLPLPRHRSVLSSEPPFSARISRPSPLPSASLFYQASSFSSSPPPRALRKRNNSRSHREGAIQSWPFCTCPPHASLDRVCFSSCGPLCL